MATSSSCTTVGTPCYNFIAAAEATVGFDSAVYRDQDADNGVGRGTVSGVGTDVERCYTACLDNEPCNGIVCEAPVP